MKSTRSHVDSHNPYPVGYLLYSLQAHLTAISEKCIRCPLCQKECAFLGKYGKPKDIADAYDPSDRKFQGMPFECSLCGLCGAVCPVKINPAEMFLEMRRETVRRGQGDYPKHASLLGYEKRGTSARYTYYALPKGCDTIFFPGCALSGTRRARVLDTYQTLTESIPNLGVVLDCCTKPSHDLGREGHFHAVFGEMRNYLRDRRIKRVIVACPNCYKVFSAYGTGLRVITVYEFLAEKGLPYTGKLNRAIVIHDPCVLRNEITIHAAVRKLVADRGIAIEEMTHSANKTVCCGEGGAVGFIAPELANGWTDLRANEAQGRLIVTYCAGCAHFLGKKTPTSHILDMIFEPEKALTGDVKVSKPPFTYLNRILLKRILRKEIGAEVSRERPPI